MLLVSVSQSATLGCASAVVGSDISAVKNFSISYPDNLA